MPNMGPSLAKIFGILTNSLDIYVDRVLQLNNVLKPFGLESEKNALTRSTSYIILKPWSRPSIGEFWREEKVLRSWDGLETHRDTDWIQACDVTG